MTKKILSIDFGTKRVGVAISVGSLAEPLCVLDHDHALEGLVKLCQEHQIEQIVFGLSENETARKTKLFAKELTELTHLPIDFADETLSSQAVYERLRSMGNKRLEGPIDHYSAALILEEYLD